MPRSKKLYYKNLDYFKHIDSEDKAYFLGLLYADGYRSPTRNVFGIELQTRDRSILEKMSLAIFNQIRLRYIEPSTKIYNGRCINSSGKYILTVHNEIMCNQLDQLGMKPKKSLVHGFPDSSQVPNHLIHHFVRGYFDGDGSISGLTHKHAIRYRITILSSNQFCIALGNIVKSLLGVNMKPVKTKCLISGIGISGNRQVKHFMDWIYKDATVYLERKYDTYQKLCADIQRIDARQDQNYSRHNNITFDKTRNKWMAHARINKKTVYVGRFESEKAAYAAQRIFIESKKESTLDA